MENLFECPKQEVWLQRDMFIDNEIESADRGGHYASDHSIALFMDLRIAYCAGAWLSVIIMSISIIDSHLRETEADDNKIGTAKLLSDYYTGEDIDWLRKLRNKYVHHNLDKPIFEMNAWFNNQDQWEQDATKAVKMIIVALFQNGAGT